MRLLGQFTNKTALDPELNDGLAASPNVAVHEMN